MLDNLDDGAVVPPEQVAALDAPPPLLHERDASGRFRSKGELAGHDFLSHPTVYKRESPYTAGCDIESTSVSREVARIQTCGQTTLTLWHYPTSKLYQRPNYCNSRRCPKGDCQRDTARKYLDYLGTFGRNVDFTPYNDTSPDLWRGLIEPGEWRSIQRAIKRKSGLYLRIAYFETPRLTIITNVDASPRKRLLTQFARTHITAGLVFDHLATSVKMISPKPPTLGASDVVLYPGDSAEQRQAVERAGYRLGQPINDEPEEVFRRIQGSYQTVKPWRF